MESVKLQYRRLGRELTPERKRISRQPRRLAEDALVVVAIVILVLQVVGVRLLRQEGTE